MPSLWMKKHKPKLAADPSETLALRYRRVSSKEQQEEGISLAVQDEQTLDYVRQKGFAPGPVFQDVMTGKRADRAHYQRLLAEVERLVGAGQAVAVVAPAVDRLGRNMAEGARAWEQLETLGARVHAIREGGELPRFTAHIFMAMAEEDNRQRAKKVRDSKRTLADAGEPPSGPAPWGYVWRERGDGEAGPTAKQVKRTLAVEPVEAAYVREAFRRAEAGATLHDLAAWVESLPVGARGGRVLGRQALRRVLRSALYVARHDGRGSADTPEAVLALPTGRWPALVDDAVWLAVQRVLDGHRAHPVAASGRYLLSGLARCPRCLAGWKGAPPAERGMAGGRAGYNVRYRCDACRHEVPCRRLDADVLARAGALVAGLAGAASSPLRPALEVSWEALRAPRGPDAGRAEAIEREVARARNRLVRAREAFYDGEFAGEGGQAEYTALLDKNRALIASLEAEKATLAEAAAAEPLPPLADVLAQVVGLDDRDDRDGHGAWIEALAGADVGAQRAVVALLVARVVPEKLGFGRWVGRLTWTDLGERLRLLVEGLPAAASRVE